SGKCYYPLLTHTSDGIVQISMPAQAAVTLGNFFDIWGQPLTTGQVGPATGTVVVYVNGSKYTGDPRALTIVKHALIQLDVCTDSVLAAVQNGRLADAAWVLTLLDDLAAYYFITIEPDDDDLRRVTPPAWRAAHDAAASRDATAHEALILGVNAAINNDLPQA